MVVVQNQVRPPALKLMMRSFRSAASCRVMGPQGSNHFESRTYIAIQIITVGRGITARWYIYNHDFVEVDLKVRVFESRHQMSYRKADTKVTRPTSSIVSLVVVVPDWTVLI